jgi:hypothetical protein
MKMPPIRKRQRRKHPRDLIGIRASLKQASMMATLIMISIKKQSGKTEGTSSSVFKTPLYCSSDDLSDEQFQSGFTQRKPSTEFSAEQIYNPITFFSK